MYFSLRNWLRISLFNFLLVAGIGVILRYKIAFALNFIDHKHLLHGHSHFAFAGWITQTLMVLLIANLTSGESQGFFKKYSWILIANLISAYGMLVSFSLQGYGLVSIIFSTLSVFVSYVFAIRYWADLDKFHTGDVSRLWFKAALLFNAISSLGAFALAGMMIKKIIYLDWYLAAEYFYLHFQYNGWFFFICIGLFTGKLASSLIPQKSLKKIFWFFACAVAPAYFLSVLWMNLPMAFYLVIVVAAFIQVLTWGWILKLLKTQSEFLKNAFSSTAGWMFKLAALALSIKLLLQLASVIPSLSDLSYGFRPIIIGYLHLVLLCVISLFILGFMVAEKHIVITKTSLTGIIVFTAGIIINEILLMIQGVTAMNYHMLPYINELLFFTAMLIFSGLVIINISPLPKRES